MLSKSLLVIFIVFPFLLSAQVQLRDTVLNWQHHSFALNENFGMASYSTNDNDIEQVQFDAKVLENDLIRLVLLPEYGGRIISFVYKPTGHEYLYHSECGSPYGIYEGNFYYDWLMVYGGIFPTFPEPEHGKAWLLPWTFDIVKNTEDTVTVAMEYTDNTTYAQAPGKFNNGITNITCRTEVSVYKGSSLWDFNVTLINNKNEDVIYEYWTCTTLTPGSDPEDTGSPLNSQMIVPIESYKAGWSPGSWIGNSGSIYDFSEIDFLSEWDDMGIAYAHNLQENYWGVINQNNKEGIFRVSENIETPGMKFWTWGKNNIDNDLFDFSNGGQDNYIELWAGVSDAFFSDAVLNSAEQKTWLESYAPTVSLSHLNNINREIAVNIAWDWSERELTYELFSFFPENEYDIQLYLEGDNYYSVADKFIIADALGNTESFNLETTEPGNYTAVLEVRNSENETVITAQKPFSVSALGIENQLSNKESVNIQYMGNRRVNIAFEQAAYRNIFLYNMSGQLVLNQSFSGTRADISFPASGLYILKIQKKNAVQTIKVIIE
jgi:hypothetical protein